MKMETIRHILTQTVVNEIFRQSKVVKLALSCTVTGMNPSAIPWQTKRPQKEHDHSPITGILPFYK
jgi:hypothetical protein